MDTKAIFSFEGISPDLADLPLSARRALDASGVRLTCTQWTAMSTSARDALVELGSRADVDALGVCKIVERQGVPRSHVPIVQSPDSAVPPQDIVDVLGLARPLTPAVWQSLRNLDRYALVVIAQDAPQRLESAYDEIVGASRVSTHLSAGGEARMVDVGLKPTSMRRATASCRVQLERATIEAVMGNDVPKGDVLATARIAGLMAVKRTPDLIPLCHPVATSHASVDIRVDVSASCIHIAAIVEAVDRTGVEMEAMTAAGVCALTVYDMLKGIDRGIVICELRLEMKEGGRSGRWERQTAGH